MSGNSKASSLIVLRKPTFLPNQLVNLVNQIFCSDQLSALTTLVCSTFCEFPTPFSHSTITHTVLTIHYTDPAMNFRSTRLFSLKKTNNTTLLTTRGSIYRNGHCTKNTSTSAATDESSSTVVGELRNSIPGRLASVTEINGP